MLFLLFECVPIFKMSDYFNKFPKSEKKSEPHLCDGVAQTMWVKRISLEFEADTDFICESVTIISVHINHCSIEKQIIVFKC